MVECSACGARSAGEARFCASCGARLAPEPSASARDQRKTVTAVFTDLVGSTSSSATRWWRSSAFRWRTRTIGARAALIDHRGPMGEADFATTEATLRDACDVLAAAGEANWYSTAVAVQASALVELGRLDEAYEATVRSEAAGAADDVVTQSYWRAARARVLARWGRRDEALKLADEAVRLIDATDGFLERGDVYAAVGETNRVLNRANEARDAFAKAIQLYEAKGAVPMVELTRARLAGVV
jgi:tetratricopeptide (TPR) repeat protein